MWQKEEQASQGQRDWNKVNLPEKTREFIPKTTRKCHRI